MRASRCWRIRRYLPVPDPSKPPQHASFGPVQAPPSPSRLTTVSTPTTPHRDHDSPHLAHRPGRPTRPNIDHEVSLLSQVAGRAPNATTWVLPLPRNPVHVLRVARMRPPPSRDAT